MELLPRLYQLQERFGYLPVEQLKTVSAETGLSVPELISRASFYEFFTLTPAGEKSHIQKLYPCRQAGTLLTPPQEYTWSAISAARAKPQDVIPTIDKAGLLGRSGGTFPVAKKWATTRDTQSDIKYVVCNADEGEPGVGKDRILLEKNAAGVIEGMAVCAAAVGATKGYIYLRGEYADLRADLEQTIAKAPLENFQIEVRMGYGAYVCGEETALLASIENQRGEPRLKPPYPGVAGLYGKPTVVNNVETFACVPLIIDRGADAFRSLGTQEYPGPKLYTVCGAVKNPGVYELDGRATVSQLLECAGGGTGELQAVLVGGGSGSLLPMGCLEMPMNPAGCAQWGAVLGSASLRFISKQESLVTVVRELTEFFLHESCGTCVPCRVGLRRLSELLKRAENGRAYPEDIEEIQHLGEHILATARCPLGKSAVTPALTLVKNFPEVLA